MLFKKLLPIFFLVISFTAQANNMLVQNVTTNGNDPVNKTIQVQFDMSWDNSWRDAINWDAAWVFIKFKDANGIWQHAQLNLAGYANGNGTANIVKVTSDKVGAWVYRSALGSGTFNSTSMQLRWNYGLNGIEDATGLEVRVFATEMVYVPEGEFNCPGEKQIWGPANFTFINYSTNGTKKYGSLYAPNNNGPVINNKITPSLIYKSHINSDASINIRIKGDLGIDTNNDGVIDNTTYPTGYKAFFCYKYELSESQYADFLNTLTPSQIANIGIAGVNIFSNNNIYYSSTPNIACGNSNPMRLLAYADWTGLRPISFTEFNKASYGPLKPFFNFSSGWAAWWGPDLITGPNVLGGYSSNTAPQLFDVSYLSSQNSNRGNSGSSYYGVLWLTNNAVEPVVKLDYFPYTITNGDGMLSSNGNNEISIWNNDMIFYVDQTWYGQWNEPNCSSCIPRYGFRYVRSAE